ncbi:coatomer epsilon subunit-domain-containing protein [Phlyctochytrium arcticum]|nr:coatomer epsilon subunit-domain-containing protein [Phlyctochytrium arcticum]
MVNPARANGNHPTDELHLLKSNFHVGSYQQVIDEATDSSKVPRSEEAQLEREVLLYRAYIAQGNTSRVVEEIPENAPSDLKAVKAFAQYIHARNAGNTNSAKSALKAFEQIAPKGKLGAMNVLTGMAYYLEEQIQDALKTVVPHPRNLECVVLAIQCYLKLDRPDAARKEVEKLKSWADDASLAQLAEAWTHCYMGGDDKVQESLYIFEELVSSKLNTGRLVAGQAICKMQMGQYDQAERILLEALRRYSNDPDVLANLVVCATATNKPTESITPYISQLRQVQPQHPLIVELSAKEALFDRAAQRYGA